MIIIFFTKRKNKELGERNAFLAPYFFNIATKLMYICIMDFNNLSAEEKFDKYSEFNTTPEADLGMMKFISNPKVPTPEINLTTPYSSSFNLLSAYRKPVKIAAVKETEDLLIDPVKPITPAADLPKIDANAYVSRSNEFHSNLPVDINVLKKQLAAVESDGHGGYKAFNSKGGGEGAVGKYQFRWTTWKDSIGSVTGIKDKETFMRTPAAQEDFFNFYAKSTLQPQVNIIKKEFPNVKYSNLELMKLLHFRGLGRKDKDDGGLRSILRGVKKTDQRIESFNLSADEYLKASK